MRDVQIPLDKIIDKLKGKCAELTLTVAGLEVALEDAQNENELLRRELSEAQEKLKYLEDGK